TAPLGSNMALDPARVQMAGAERHPFELDAVWIQEIYRIVVLVVLPGRIDDVDVVGLQERFQLIDIAPASQLQSVVMKADVPLVRPPCRRHRVGRRDPECSAAISPAGHVAEMIDDRESKKVEQAVIEFLRSFVVTDANDYVIDTQNLHYLFVP